MRASTACISSSGETLRARYRRRSSTAGTKQRSDALTTFSFADCRSLGGENLAGIQRVPKSVADEIDAEHGQEDRGARKDGPVGREVEIVLGVVQDPPPRRDVRREAEAQEGQRGLRDD